MIFFATFKEGGEFKCIKSRLKSKKAVLKHFFSGNEPLSAILFLNGYMFDKGKSQPRHKRIVKNITYSVRNTRRAYKRLRQLVKIGEVKVINLSIA